MAYLSSTSNKDLMAQAREDLKGQWGLAIGVGLLYSIITIGIGYVPYLGAIAPYFIAGPFSVGMCLFFLALCRKQEPRVSQLFEGFNRFVTLFAAYVLLTIFIILWTLLLIIPGIIASISYSMTYYILADNPTMSAIDAIRKSKEMMRGNKRKYFYLGLRFLGWTLLAVLTLGIGFIWLAPYMYTAYTKFYEDLKIQEEVKILEPVDNPAEAM